MDEKAAEAALRESEYRYRNLFQAMAAAFWELDFNPVGQMLRGLRKAGVADYAAYFAENPDFVRQMMAATRVIDVNEQTVALFGRGDKAEMLQRLDVYWPEESSHVFAASVVAAVTGAPSYAAECRLRTLDGRMVDALFTASFAPESVAAGRLLIGVIDISERVAAQSQLARVQAEFAHAARVSMLGELTASIAHEVNQPLAAIATHAAAGLRWIDRPEPDLAEVRALTVRVGDDARRAAAIIARVRSMVMRHETERERLSMNGVIEESVLFVRHDLQGRGVSLTLDLAADLPPVLGDRTQLQQVAVNLAVNAAQAMAGMDGARITVTSRLEDGRVVVSVADTGPGFGEAGPGRLFESFYSTKPAGMGMGLPICRSIVEAHGGSISAAEGEGGGAVFTVSLPAA